MHKDKKRLQIALICGGPSQERGISLNSARSVLDHLHGDTIEVVPFYIDHQMRPYQLQRSQMYSNTPSDFDYKLHTTATSLTKKKFAQALQRVDIVFPVIHGSYGEDGTLQKFLEKNNIPFIGSSSTACQRAFDKYEASHELEKNNFPTIPSLLIEKGSISTSAITSFCRKADTNRFIVKPARGGSSIGVHSVATTQEIVTATEHIFDTELDTRVIVEPFIRGREFTVALVENRFGLPVALLPTEIETNYNDHQIFDYRKKYLPTNAARHHCPPRFNDTIIQTIQEQAENIFALFDMRHIARFDGWVCDDGAVVFTDFNPFNGMEQNSFMFQQGARVGMTHADMLSLIVRNACRTYGIAFPEQNNKDTKKRKPLPVIFGGATSERQVSVMSGTNVWLKLRGSKIYNPQPFLLDSDEKTVWSLPYDFALEHTVEEISGLISRAEDVRNDSQSFIDTIRTKLAESPSLYNVDLSLPQKQSLATFIKKQPFLFLGLHGGIGESGVLQKKLEKYGVSHNGTGAESAKLCMDKWMTNQKIAAAKATDIYVLPQKKIAYTEFKRSGSCTSLWKVLKKELDAETVIVKPRGDGCSSGIVRLYTADDLKKYITLLHAQAGVIMPGTFTNQHSPIEMPNVTPADLLFEPFVETDKLRVVKNKLVHTKVSGKVEITCGVVEIKGTMYAFNPSITVAEGEVLSVEEKFQGGTGINLTPPPDTVMPSNILTRVKRNMEKVAAILNISGYARIDAFVDIATGDTYVIEANTLPALTPSTVIYQQALNEGTPLFPRDFLELLIRNKGY